MWLIDTVTLRLKYFAVPEKTAALRNALSYLGRCGIELRRVPAPG